MSTCRCGREFTPARPWQRHCSAKCRKQAFRDAEGEVVSVRQTKRGWSVTLYFERQPAAGAGEFVTVMRSGRISPPAPEREQLSHVARPREAPMESSQLQG